MPTFTPKEAARRLALVLCVAVLGALAPMQAWAQDERSEIEQRLDDIRQQIQASEQRLSETNEAERASEEQLEGLDRRIAERSELTRLYEQRLDEIQREEDSLQTSLRQRRLRLDALKTEYKRRATHAYKYGRLHDLALVLAARSVNEMVVRVHYLRRFARQRREKLEAVEAASRQIREQREALQARRDSTASLLRQADAQRRNLSRLSQSRRSMIQELRAQQSAIEENLNEQQAAAQKLQQDLERLASAARLSNSERREASPERRAAFERLTGSFEQNRGRLPWPAEGVVTEGYGLQTNPVHGTKTENPGVMVATRPQANVQAVFEGQVSRIDNLPELGRLVFVRHGQYLSLYGNLSLIYVQEGQNIQAGATVGRAGTDGEPRGAGVFFALFQNSTSFDPTDWLRDR